MNDERVRENDERARVVQNNNINKTLIHPAFRVNNQQGANR